MATLQLRFTLEGLGASESEIALGSLQQWLEEAGFNVELETEPPVADEMGGMKKTVVLYVSLSLMAEALHQTHQWQQQEELTGQVVLHSTGNQEHDDDIREVLKREGIHIEVRELEQPVRNGKPSVTESPPTGKK